MSNVIQLFSVLNKKSQPRLGYKGFSSDSMGGVPSAGAGGGAG